MLLLLASPALATGNHEEVVKCGDSFTFTVDEDDDSHLTFAESGNKLDSDFNGGSDDRNESINTANAGDGYLITSVKYDNETSGTNWIVVPVVNPTTTINLAGNSDSTRIDKVEIVVQKTCTQVCDDPEATNYQEPIVGQTEGNKELCEYQLVCPEGQEVQVVDEREVCVNIPEEPPVATPSATPTPPVTELPKTGDFNFWQAVALVEALLLVGFGIKYRFRKDQQ